MSDYKAIKEALHGCSNHSCVIKKPVGMGTNGPCHCLDDKQKLQRFAYIRNEEIKDLREQLLLSQKREMDLREYIVAIKQLVSFPETQLEISIDTLADAAISTPPTLDALNQWRDSFVAKAIEKAFGEPVAWVKPDFRGNGYATLDINHSYKFSPTIVKHEPIPLYARKAE